MVRLRGFQLQRTVAGDWHLNRDGSNDVLSFRAMSKIDKNLLHFVKDHEAAESTYHVSSTRLHTHGIQLGLTRVVLHHQSSSRTLVRRLLGFTEVQRSESATNAVQLLRPIIPKNLINLGFCATRFAWLIHTCCPISAHTRLGCTEGG